MGEPVPPTTSASPQPPEDRRLDSWKEIAAYLNRDVTTVQRWEKREGMPVHRHLHDRAGSIYAFRSELDAWVRARTLRATQESGITPASSSVAPPLVPAEPPTRARVNNGIWAAVVAAALSVTLLLALPAIRRESAGVSADRRGTLAIMVVPLQNLSEDPGQDYFVDGLTEEILTQLGQLNPERLRVVKYRPSTSARQVTPIVMPANDAPGPQYQLAQYQLTQYQLEGSVRRHHEQARITVRLVRVADQTTLWTDSFDRKVGDVLSLQSEIAQRVGRELQIQVLGHADLKLVAPEVMETYLRGRFEMSHRFETGQHPPDAAGAYFERVIALDPSFAPAHAGLADFYRSRAVGDDEGAEEAWRLAEQHATQALSLDSDNAEAHTAMAEIKLMHEWNWRAAREHALRALQLNPSSPDAHAAYARYLRVAGNVAEAVNQRKEALALDPLRVDLKVGLAYEYLFARNYKSGVALARQMIDHDPDFAHSTLCVGLGRLKLFDDSVTECGKALSLDGHNEWVSAYMRKYREQGYDAAMLFVAKKELDEIRRRPKPDLWELANGYVSAGRHEEALHTLFQGLSIHEPGLLQIRVDPDFDPIRNNPRYAELVRRIGFPSDQRAN